MRTLALLALAGCLALAQSGATLQAKLALIQHFARSSGPYHDVTITAAEANAYFAGAGAARLPAAVSDVVLGAQPGELTGSARIDFDRLAAQRPGNPLLLLFAGQHTLSAVARVDSAQAPEAQLTVTEVRLDGEPIPNFLIDAAVAAFLHPKYPSLGRHFAIALPAHARAAVTGAGSVTLLYR